AARREVEMAVPAVFAVSGGHQMHRRDQVRQILGLLLCSGHGGGGEQVLELGAQAAAEQGQPEEKDQGGERQQEQNKVLHMVNGILSVTHGPVPPPDGSAARSTRWCLGRCGPTGRWCRGGAARSPGRWTAQGPCRRSPGTGPCPPGRTGRRSAPGPPPGCRCRCRTPPSTHFFP